MKLIIRFFGLKGSWKWAKKQMLKGHEVSCKHFTGTLKYKIDSPKNGLLLCDWSSSHHRCWETYNHHIGIENHTDFYIVNK